MDRRRTMMGAGTPEPEIEYDWLRFDILNTGTVLWKCVEGNARTISFRKNGGNWVKITSTTDGYVINVITGDVLEFKGNNTNYGTNNGTKGSYFNGTATFDVSGDISTMLGNSDVLLANYALAFLFSQANVVSANDLILPYINLRLGCYANMF